MPDDTFRGKRLHVERLVAAGMYAKPVDPPQDALDAARALIDRLLELHRPPTHPWRLFAVACGGMLVFVGLVMLILPGGAR